jgi:tetratricopeptide (TPR) repeat protein
MLARCLFSLGQYRDAAYHYEQFLACDRSPSAFRVAGHDPDKGVMQTIAKCYQRAGDVGEAKLFLEKCLAKYPDAPGLYLQMAELCAQEADYLSAYDCLRKEVEVNPEAETDLGIRLGLALGYNSTGEKDILAVVEKHLSSNPSLMEQLESVVEVHWPTFANLSDLARDSWACGTYMMLLPHADPKARQNFRRGAAAKFAVAVEIEMRSRVFSKFQHSIQRNPGLTKLDGLVDEDKKLLTPFADFLLGKRPFGLGEMIKVLDIAQKLDKPLCNEFNAWVNREFPGLTGQRSKLYQIRDFRNPEIHGDPSSADPQRCPDLCRRVLDSLATPHNPARE